MRLYETLPFLVVSNPWSLDSDPLGYKIEPLFHLIVIIFMERKIIFINGSQYEAGFLNTNTFLLGINLICKKYS